MGNASQKFWDCALNRAGLAASALRNISSSCQNSSASGQSSSHKSNTKLHFHSCGEQIVSGETNSSKPGLPLCSLSARGYTSPKTSDYPWLGFL